MKTISDLYELIDGFAPFSTQLDFDNSGLCVGDPSAQVEGILLTTDVTPEVVDEAVEKDCNVIISHHPVIFKGVKEIVAGKGMLYDVIAKAVKADVALIAAHTNLDDCDGGLNDYVAQELGLQVTDSGECLRIGELETDATVTLGEYAAFVADKLGDPTVRYVGDDDKIIQTVAVGTGAGGRDEKLIAAPAEKGVDGSVTAEVKHSVALEAKAAGVGIIECTHHATEKCACAVLGELLDSVGYEYFISEKDEDPYKPVKN